jgi:ubiquinone/menaquinone biosynthesis C-methylase UbiE
MTSPISRVTRTKAQARASYNRLSRWYDAFSGSSEAKYRDLGLQKLNPQPGETILEIGFGTGQGLLALAKATGETGKVYGIDLSDGMVALAQKRVSDTGLEARVDLRLGDASQLPFPKESFDGIFMSFTLELFDTPEIPLVLDQCRKVLRPGGRMALVTLTKSSHPGTAERIYEWFHARLPALVDCRPILAQDALREAGFIIVDEAPFSMWGLPVEIILARTL